MLGIDLAGSNGLLKFGNRLDLRFLDSAHVLDRVFNREFFTSIIATLCSYHFSLTLLKLGSCLRLTTVDSAGVGKHGLGNCSLCHNNAGNTDELLSL